MFGIAELVGEDGVGFGDALLLVVDEGLTEGEEEPVAVRDQDVMEKLAEFGIVSGGRMVIDRADEVGVGPPFMADELVEEGKHGGNVADALSCIPP